MTRRGVVIFACAAAAGLAAFLAVTRMAVTEEPMRLAADPTPLIITGNGPDASFIVEVADDPDERARGLMFRTDLKSDQAMLFIFDKDRKIAMWMKNTPLPLDMLFVQEDGTITNIAKNTVPQSEEVIPSGGPVRFVLEINAGLADALGIETGERLVHPAIGG
jgi:uncharacterized protein